MVDLLYIIVFTFIAAFIDYEHLSAGYYIKDHRSRAALRFLFFIAAGSTCLASLGMALFFAATFDTTLNLLRGKKLLHLGNTAYWDRFFNKQLWLYKLVISTAFLWSLYILLWL